MMDNNDTTEVLIKDFGIDGDKPCALNILSFDEKVKLRARLDYWTYRLNEKDKKKRKQSYDYKTLNEILGLSYEDTIYFVNTLDKDSQIYNIIINVFGNDLKGRLEKDKLEKEVYTKLLSNLNNMKKIINGNNVYKNKYLSDIVSIDLDKIKTYVDEEELVILKKAFGENLDRRFINTVSVKVLTKVINNLNKQIKEEVKMKSETKANRGKKSMYENMTLDMILGISYEEVLDIFNETRKETKIYKIFAKAFGEDFKDKFDLSQLEHNEKIMLYNKINRLKKKFLGNLENKKTAKKENDDLNKYYMTIIGLMPKEYKTILSLYFENYSLDKIANLMDLDINDVNNRLKEGILFMEKIISLYNKTFDEKIPENEKMLR